MPPRCQVVTQALRSAARDVLPRHGRPGRRDRRRGGAGRHGRDGRAVAVGDVGAQTKQALENVRAIVEAAGCTMGDVVRLQTFLTHAEDIRRLHGGARRGLPGYFPDGAYPPNTLLVVSRLVQPELLVEVEAMAVKPAAAPPRARPRAARPRGQAAEKRGRRGGRRRGSADDRGARAVQRRDVLRRPPRGGGPRRQGGLLPRRGLDHLRGPPGAGQPHRQRAARARRAARSSGCCACCLDAPEFLGAFWGAIKIGAVPIPRNTMMRAADYLYFLDDSRAPVAIVSEALLAEAGPALAKARYLRHVLVAGARVRDADRLRELGGQGLRAARALRHLEGRCRVLALLLGLHRPAEGRGAPAARHGRVLGHLRARRCSA